MSELPWSCPEGWQECNGEDEGRQESDQWTCPTGFGHLEETGTQQCQPLPFRERYSVLDVVSDAMVEHGKVAEGSGIAGIGPSVYDVDSLVDVFAESSSWASAEDWTRFIRHAWMVLFFHMDVVQSAMCLTGGYKTSGDWRAVEDLLRGENGYTGEKIGVVASLNGITRQFGDDKRLVCDGLQWNPRVWCGSSHLRGRPINTPMGVGNYTLPITSKYSLRLVAVCTGSPNLAALLNAYLYTKKSYGEARVHISRTAALIAFSSLLLHELIHASNIEKFAHNGHDACLNNYAYRAASSFRYMMRGFYCAAQSSLILYNSRRVTCVVCSTVEDVNNMDPWDWLGCDLIESPVAAPFLVGARLPNEDGWGIQ